MTLHVIILEEYGGCGGLFYMTVRMVNHEGYFRKKDQQNTADFRIGIFYTTMLFIRRFLEETSKLCLFTVDALYKVFCSGNNQIRPLYNDAL